MTAAMRQGAAAEAAESGLGMAVAGGISKVLGEKGYIAKAGEAMGGEIGKNIAQGMAAGITLGNSFVAGQAADQFLADNKKIAGELRKSIDSKKQKEKDLSKLIAGLTGEEEKEEAKPADKPAADAPAAKPAGGGGDAH